MIELSELLDPSRIRCQCDIRSKKRALQTLAELLGVSLTDMLDSSDDEDSQSDMDIFDALVTRERLGSTALGHGIALPHSRLAQIEEPIAAMITLSEGVDFEAADNQPVDILVALLVPEHCNDEHLKILASLAKRFNQQIFRDEVRTFGTDQADALYSYLQLPAPAA